MRMHSLAMQFCLLLGLAAGCAARPQEEVRNAAFWKAQWKFGLIEVAEPPSEQQPAASPEEKKKQKKKERLPAWIQEVPTSEPPEVTQRRNRMIDEFETNRRRDCFDRCGNFRPPHDISERKGNQHYGTTRDGIELYYLGRKRRADKAYWLVTSAMFATAVLDVESTARCLNAGTCREANPLYGPSPTRRKMYGIRIPMTAALSYLIYKQKRRDDYAKDTYDFRCNMGMMEARWKKPRAAWKVMAGIALGFWGGVVIHNYSAGT